MQKKSLYTFCDNTGMVGFMRIDWMIQTCSFVRINMKKNLKKCRCYLYICY